MERKYETFLGTGLLIAGIVILLFVFAQMLPIAANPGKFVTDQVPDSQKSKAPTPSFSWSSNGLSVQFTDTSQAGSAPITSYSWDFGDGSSGNTKNTAHTYANPQDYNVRLTIQDQNGTSETAKATVHPNQSGTNSGSGQMDNSGGSFDVSFTPFAMAMVFMAAYLILYLVGASILKAGWNLINPKAEKITLRVKPKHIEVEPVTPPAQAAQPQVVYVQAPPQQQQYQPPPPPPQG